MLIISYLKLLQLNNNNDNDNNNDNNNDKNNPDAKFRAILLILHPVVRRPISP